jgi:cell division septal protein FtsQ
MARDFLDISRRRKRRWALVKLFGWSFAAVLILAGIGLVFYLPVLRINTLAFEGLDAINEEELSRQVNDILSGKYLLLLPKNNIVFFPKKELSELLKSNRRIKNFSFDRNFENRLLLTVEERATWAIWCYVNENSAEKCALTDDDGFVFSPSPFFSGTAILKIIDQRNEDLLGKYVLPQRHLEELKTFIKKTKSRLGEDVFVIELKKGEVLTLKLKNGWSIILDSETDITRAFENLVLALDSQIKDSRQNLDYIDLRFSNKVFYKLR